MKRLLRWRDAEPTDTSVDVARILAERIALADEGLKKLIVRLHADHRGSGCVDLALDVRNALHGNGEA